MSVASGRVRARAAASNGRSLKPAAGTTIRSARWPATSRPRSRTPAETCGSRHAARTARSSEIPCCGPRANASAIERVAARDGHGNARPRVRRLYRRVRAEGHHRAAVEQRAQRERVLGTLTPRPRVPERRRCAGGPAAPTRRRSSLPKRGWSAGSTSCACSTRRISGASFGGSAARTSSTIRTAASPMACTWATMPAAVARRRSARSARALSVRTIPARAACRRVRRGVGVRLEQRRADARSERAVGEELQPAHRARPVRSPLRSPSSIARSSCGRESSHGRAAAASPPPRARR